MTKVLVTRANWMHLTHYGWEYFTKYSELYINVVCFKASFVDFFKGIIVPWTFTYCVIGQNILGLRLTDFRAAQFAKSNCDYFPPYRNCTLLCDFS